MSSNANPSSAVSSAPTHAQTTALPAPSPALPLASALPSPPLVLSSASAGRAGGGGVLSPVVVFIHGGAWGSGYKLMYRMFGRRLDRCVRVRMRHDTLRARARGERDAATDPESVNERQGRGTGRKADRCLVWGSHYVLCALGIAERVM